MKLVIGLHDGYTLTKTVGKAAVDAALVEDCSSKEDVPLEDNAGRVWAWASSCADTRGMGTIAGVVVDNAVVEDTVVGSHGSTEDDAAAGVGDGISHGAFVHSAMGSRGWCSSRSRALAGPNGQLRLLDNHSLSCSSSSVAYGI